MAERQGLLNALADEGGPLGQSNLPELESDGEFGSKTLMRVKEFQSRNNLIVDGVIGQQTDIQMDALWIQTLTRLQQNASKN